MNQPKKNEQAVAKKESSAVAAPTIDLSMVAQDQGQGLASVDMESMAIPFLKILSSMSPQTKKQKSEYVDGAEEGMIFNTVTEELHDGTEGISVIPCYFEPVALEWTDRGTGSSAPVQVLISMKVSGLSKSRKWNSLVMSAKVKNGEQIINPPSWYYSYTLTTKPQSNDKGDWYSWDIKRGDVVSANQYEEGKRFHNAVKKGSVEVNYEQANESSGKDKPDTDNPF
jgi:hypothetical protein